MGENQQRKKRRTGGACFHCHNAKRACETERPCTRCKSKNLDCFPFVPGNPSIPPPPISSFTPIPPITPITSPVPSILSSISSPISSDAIPVPDTTALPFIPASYAIQEQQQPALSTLTEPTQQPNFSLDFLEQELSLTSYDLSFLSDITVPPSPLPPIQQPVAEIRPTQATKDSNCSSCHCDNSSTSDKPAYSMWDIESKSLRACNTPFQQLTGFSMDELGNSFLFSTLIPTNKCKVDESKLWKFLDSVARAQQRIELKMCLRSKDGSGRCVGAVIHSTKDGKSIIMELAPVSACDDKWSIGDFTHFPTYKVPPSECDLTGYSSIFEAWDIVGGKCK